MSYVKYFIEVRAVQLVADSSRILWLLSTVLLYRNAANRKGSESHVRWVPIARGNHPAYQSLASMADYPAIMQIPSS